MAHAFAQRATMPYRVARWWGRLVGSYGLMVVDHARVERIEDAPFPETPCIWVGWHSSVLITLALHLRLRARPVTGFSPVGVGGESMAAWLDVFNVEAVPIHGTAFDGIMLRQLRRAVAAGRDVLIAADGPAGPRWRARPGALWLGSVARVPVVPVGIAASPAISLPRWDRHLVPLPGARLAMAVGMPMPEVAVRSPGATTALQSAIDGLTARARAALRAPPAASVRP
jgi:lysophospholipid acyltransferase (LPLAT)-like uncharacterized protein